MSATDASFAITAILEHPDASEPIDLENKDPNQNVQSMQELSTKLRDNFWVAYDSLDCKPNSTCYMLKGIELAKDMQQAIVRIGIELIEK